MPKFLIIDDHPIVRKGIRQILEEMSGVIITDEAASAAEGLKKFNQNDYDVVLLDIHLPGKSGLDVLGDMKYMKPGIPVLIISMYPEEQYAIRVLKSGASGYLTKESAPDELLAAIRKVLDGRRYITQALAEKIFDGLDKDHRRHEMLSNREYEVMIQISRGKSIKEIAGILSVSEKTVSTYRSRTLEKMGMNSNAELMKYVIQEGLID